jgi:hypothetical protein
MELNKRSKKINPVKGTSLSESSKPIVKKQAKPLQNKKKEVEETKKNKQSSSLSSNISSYPP